jgi:hypothetical protein
VPCGRRHPRSDLTRRLRSHARRRGPFRFGPTAGG